MSKRQHGGKQTDSGDAAIEQKIVAFAEQLGRIVGTVQAKAEGWTDRGALREQIASVRDGAAELLEQLADGVTGRSKSALKSAIRAVPNAKPQGRSGGVVDAPGKKHRKPMPKDPGAVAASARRSSMRAGKASMKTMKQRGRG